MPPTPPPPPQTVTRPPMTLPVNGVAAASQPVTSVRPTAPTLSNSPQFAFPVVGAQAATQRSY